MARPEQTPRLLTLRLVSPSRLHTFHGCMVASCRDRGTSRTSRPRPVSANAFALDHAELPPRLFDAAHVAFYLRGNTERPASDLSSAGWGLLSHARISMSIQRRWPVDRRNERPQRGRSPDAPARVAVTARLATALPGYALRTPDWTFVMVCSVPGQPALSPALPATLQSHSSLGR